MVMRLVAEVMRQISQLRESAYLLRIMAGVDGQELRGLLEGGETFTVEFKSDQGDDPFAAGDGRAFRPGYGPQSHR